MALFGRDPAYVTTMRDGTVKQLNPFSGTEVWTVPGRGNRPLGIPAPTVEPLEQDGLNTHCVFCPGHYRQTPPEKSRVVRDRTGQWVTQEQTPAADLDKTTAEFRRIPNLFEILSYEYWHANYGYELPDSVRKHETNYLASVAGRDHVTSVARNKLRAMGNDSATIEKMSAADLLGAASGFFGGGHDVIVAKRHFTEGATNTSQLASAGTLTPDEHEQFIRFTVVSAKNLADLNRYARYIAVFQNWLRPAGASIDHLHKQLVAIDEHGPQYELATERLRANPNVFNDDAANYAAYTNLMIAENEGAIAFAGFGHRYPTIEIYSKAPAYYPWDHTPEQLRSMSDLIHAMHAATGASVPTNEEWHYRPLDSVLPMPWRVMLKWRVSTVAGFEGATKIYLNTIDPAGVRDRIVPELFRLRDLGAIADIRIATECHCQPNPLRYTEGG